MQDIIISIITCTFNSEKYLRNALQSVENQTYQEIEHIINDAYSTDSTLDIIREYIERNKNRYVIKLIQSEPKGVGNALNVATKEATGEIIHYYIQMIITRIKTRWRKWQKFTTNIRIWFGSQVIS